MGWRAKIFQKIKESRNKYAKGLGNKLYRQRIKQSEKNYSRKDFDINKELDIYKEMNNE